MRSILRKLGREDGVEILEAALVLPLVFMFVLGIVWFGRAFNIYSAITQAAQQGAIAAARPPCASCAPSATSADSAVLAVLQAAKLDVTLVSAPTTAPAKVCSTTAANVMVCPNAILNSPTGTLPDQCNLVSPNQNPPDQCGTIVAFRYSFTSNLPFTSLNLQTVVMNAQAQTRTEN